MQQFSPTQVVQHLENAETECVLLDVREPWEFDICRIENSINLPMGQIVNKLDELDKNLQYIVICHHGVRSLQVAMYLSRNGFTNIINLQGGVDAWARDVDIHMPVY